MKELIEKLKKILVELEHENGIILFYALFLREDSPNKWDLMISADWLEYNKVESYQTIASKTQSILSQNELTYISRIVILDNRDPIILFFRSSFEVSGDSYLDLANCELSSTNIKLTIIHAYILRCVQK